MKALAFEPLSPDALVSRLAAAVDRLSSERVRVGFDGDDSVGTADLADAVAAELRSRGRPAVRVSSSWWWRAASLRLEYGREDVESRLHGWVDVGSLRREVFDPFAPDGSGRHLSRLRDPGRDRAVREEYSQASPSAVLVVDGALLQTAGLPFDLVVRVGVSSGRLARTLPAERQWELAAFAEYDRQWPPVAANPRSVGAAEPGPMPLVLISYDHPGAPAVRGLS